MFLIAKSFCWVLAQVRTRAPMAFIPVLLGLAVSACSPGAFFGNKQDDKLLKAKGYRQINTACANVNLSRLPEVSDFKSFISCMNGNGALGACHTLVNNMADEDLAPLV